MKSDLERAREAENLTQKVERIETWMRRTMRFVDLCDADAAGYDDLHDEADHLLRVGFSIFGFDPDGRFASIDNINININPLPLRDDLAAMLAFAKSECATRDAEIEKLTGVLHRCEEWFARVRPTTDEANDYLNEDGWDDMASIHDAARAALSNKDAG